MTMSNRSRSRTCDVSEEAERRRRSRTKGPPSERRQRDSVHEARVRASVLTVHTIAAAAFWEHVRD